MGAIMKEKGVLKLVHPGRYVEIHTKPIAAAEVMRRNPRHCITRPDVFEFPWIVVKPESVLNLGKVFFIVPNHTIYCLLKARGQYSFQQNHSPKNPDHHHLKQISLMESTAGMTPKHQKHYQWSKKQFQRVSQEGVSPWKQDWDENCRKSCQVTCLPGVIVKLKKTCQGNEREFSVDSTAKIRSSHAKKHRHFNDNSINAALPQNQYGILDATRCQQVTMLKSCLRKPDSARKLLGLRVTFVLPNKDDEKPKRVTAFQECEEVSLHLNNVQIH